MAKIMLPYLEKGRVKGRLYFYYRRNGQRISLPTDPATKEFMDHYTSIHEGYEKGKASSVILPGSIKALIEVYKKSSEYKSLGEDVRKTYLRNLDMIAEKLGGFQARTLTRRVVLEWRDGFSATPAKANTLVKVISRLYSFAVERGMVTQNPLMKIHQFKNGERRPWKPEEIKKFQKKSSPTMCLALSLGLYTGQRLGDVIRMRWNQISDGGIEVTQQKTGEKVWIPLHEKLKASLGKIKAKSAVTILTSASGVPYKADYFKHQFKAATRKADLPDDLVFHGLRKTAAVMMAESGCTTEQIKSITGHRTDNMAAYYAKQANQKTLARAAIKKFERKIAKPS